MKMIHTLRKGWKEHRFITAAFLVSTGITLFLLLRLLFSVIYWSQHTNMAPEPWMRLNYLSKSHSVQIERLREAIGLDPNKRERRTLSQIASDKNIEPSQLLQTLTNEINEIKSQSKNKMRAPK